MGVPSILLNQSEIAAASPSLEVSDLAFGLYCPDDGEIDPKQLVDCYANRAAELGVQFGFNEEAVTITAASGHVNSVITDRRTIHCRYIVNAAGANARAVSSWLGVSTPIDNRRRSIYIGQCDAAQPLGEVMVEDASLEWYFRPLSDGRRILVGMGLEPDVPGTNGPNLGFLPEVRRAAAQRAPSLANFRVVEGYSGVRSLTPDGLPIIGPVDEVEGLILSCGWGGEGIMHAPAAGGIVADWINNTETISIDRSAFLQTRFAQ